MSPTERERCPTCDHELATAADQQRALRFAVGAGLCWSDFNDFCSHPPIDWRKRCLAAEAQQAGGDVRPLVEALELLLEEGGRQHTRTLHMNQGTCPCSACSWWRASRGAQALVDAYRAHERTEGRAGDGEAKRG